MSDQQDTSSGHQHKPLDRAKHGKQHKGKSHWREGEGRGRGQGGYTAVCRLLVQHWQLGAGNSVDR